MWIQHGGQVYLPLMGGSINLELHDTLQVFIRHLGGMPWGSAVLQKQVLSQLQESEKATADTT